MHGHYGWSLFYSVADFAEIKIELESPNSAIGNLFPEDDSTGVSFCAVIDGDPGLMNLMAITVSVDIELGKLHNYMHFM